jgi:nucleoside-diphosphate-sugar epimerase
VVFDNDIIQLEISSRFHYSNLLTMEERTMSNQVAVTGAGGSLGQSLVRRLLARGFNVKGLVRNQKNALEIEQIGGVPVMGDVREPSSLEMLLEGCSVVFHLAAWIPGSGAGWHKIADDINVMGTANVVRLAAEKGCRRVVHASSISVYGPMTEGLVTEATPLHAVGDPYGATKIMAEKLGIETAQRHGVEFTILRPTMIYGPRSPSWTMGPYNLISRGLPAVLGDGEGLLDAVYVDDVAQAFELAGFDPNAAGEVFIIGNETVTCNTFMRAYAKMAQTRLRRLPVPLASFGMHLISRASRVVLGKPITVPEMVGIMTSRATFSSEKARRMLGYKPEFKLAEGMYRTRVWLMTEGKLRFPSTALVTGAGGGLGQAIAKMLSEKGVEVWASDLSETSLAQLPPEVHTIGMDITSDASIKNVIQIVSEKTGGIDLLINVAGVLKAAPLESQSISDVMQHMEVNAIGPLRVSRAVSAGMRQRRRGRIVNIGSTNCYMVMPFLGAYSGSKYALRALSDGLRMELSPWGVEVVIIHPGSMKTRMADNAKQNLQDELGQLGKDWQIPLTSFLNSWLWGTKFAIAPETNARIVTRVAMARRVRRGEIYTDSGTFLIWVYSLLPSFLRDSLLLSRLDRGG